jgi:methylmalonyl-CoA/ethylmalonyl-CoA epimerase
VTPLRRLDHVGVAVTDTELALEYFVGRLGLEVASSEVIETPHVRLTYLDAGSIYIQLVEPLDDESPIAAHLAEHGEGVHHVAFGVDDVPGAAAALADDGAPAVALGSGRGRPSAFVPGDPHHGVRLEVTGFDRAADVTGRSGLIDQS